MRYVLAIVLLLLASDVYAQKYIGPGALTGPVKIFSTGSGGAITYIDGLCGGSTTGNTFTTTQTMNSTGANFVGLHVSYNQGSSFTITDTFSNSYQCKTLHEILGSFGSKICFAENASVGAGHAIIITGTGHFAGVCAKAFANVTAGSFDQQNGATVAFTGATTIATGPVTPTVGGELILSGAAWSKSATIAVDVPSGLAITKQIDLAASQHYGSALAHVIQSTPASTVNATWSGYSNTDGEAASIATFGKAPTIGIQLVEKGCIGSPDGTAVTSNDYDISGSNFVVFGLGDQTDPGSTIADNKSNGAPTALTANAAGTFESQIRYYTNPTVGSGWHFTLTPVSGTQSFASACFMAFKGLATSSVSDGQQNGNNANTFGGDLSIVTGASAITPSNPNSLVIATMTFDKNNTPTIDSGFSNPVLIEDFTAFSHFGLAMSYLVQSAAVSVNPTWTWSNPASARSSIASFKP